MYSHRSNDGTNMLCFECTEVQQSQLDELHSRLYHRLVLRVNFMRERISIKDFPIMIGALIESGGPACIHLSNLPSMQRVLLKNVVSVTSELMHTLEYFEIDCKKFPKGMPPIEVPPTEGLSIRRMDPQSYRVLAPALLLELSYSGMRRPVVREPWWEEIQSIDNFHTYCVDSVDTEGLRAFKKLRILTLMDSGDIRDIDFVREMPSLQHVNFGGSTKILSGDLRPLLDLKDIKSIVFANRRHYNMFLDSELKWHMK